MALTDTQLKALKPRAKPYIVSDGDGLYVEVLPTGGVCWRYRYRLTGKQEKVSLGQYPDLSLKIARQKRAELAALVAQGESPAHRKQQAKAELSHALTVREFATIWINEIVRRDRKNPRIIEQYLAADILPAIGDKHLRNVTSLDVQAIVFRKRDGGRESAAALLRGILKRHPITHNLSVTGIHSTAGLQRDGKRSDLLHAFPDRLGTGMTVLFAPEKPAEAGDQPHPLSQGWRCCRRWVTVGHDPGGLPFLGIEPHVARQIRAVPAPGHQVQDAPGDDEVNDQGPLQPLQGGQLQGLDLAARFPNSEENFHEPAPPIPVDEFDHLLQRLGGPVGQQPPFNRLLAGRRAFLAGQNRRHGHGGLAVMRRQRHPFAIQRLPHQPGGTIRRRRQGEFDLPQRFALGQPRPQLLTGGGLAIVLGPDQPVRRRAAPSGGVDQRPQVAFPIRHVHPPAIGHGLGPIGDDLVTLDPAGAFLDIGRVFRLPRPHPGVQHPQRQPRRRHRQSRMHVQTVLSFVAQSAQPCNPRLRGEIQFRRVLNAQDHRLARHPLHRPRGMDLQNLPPLDRWVVQQPVGRFGFRPASAGQRDAPGRLRRPIVHQLDQALGPPLIPQLQIVKLGLCPIHVAYLPLDEKLNLNNELGFVGNRVP